MRNLVTKFSLAATLFTASAFASSLPYTFSVGVTPFNVSGTDTASIFKFDNALGTLTSIVFTISNSTSYAQDIVTNNTGGTNTYTWTPKTELTITQGASTLVDSNLVGAQQTATLNNGDTTTFSTSSVIGSKSSTYDSGGTLTGGSGDATISIATYIGSYGCYATSSCGNIPVGFGAAYNGTTTGGVSTQTSSGNSNATITVTYNYIDAPPPTEGVPEPTTLAMLGGGIMLIGAAKKFRRS